MTNKTIHIKRATLAFPTFFENGSRDENGNILVNSASFIVDANTASTQKLMSQFDKITSDISKSQFNSDGKAYDAIPVTVGDTIMKNGVQVQSMRGKLIIRAENVFLPTLLDNRKQAITYDSELLYAGAIVYAIVELSAREAQGKRYLNASFNGMMFLEHGTPIGRPKKLATADDFDVEVAA